jgi:membrane protease YdiL (CAAX protease family)
MATGGLTVLKMAGSNKSLNSEQRVALRTEPVTEQMDDHSRSMSEIGAPLSEQPAPVVAAGPPPPTPDSRRPDLRGAQPITDRKLRRLFGWETLVVLSIFPLGSTIVAISYLLMRLTTGVEISGGNVLIPGEPGLSLALSMGLIISEFSAAGLVIYLLIRNGEGLTSIGLSGHRFRRDLALVLPVWFFVQVIPQVVGSAIVTAAHIPRFSVASPPAPTVFVAAALLMSLNAAVVEEIVVLGYLVRRLEQRGWSPTTVVIIAVLVRVSYHLYYGAGVLPIVLWATASVVAYRKIRRLMPFIICHFVWDANIAINGYSHSAAIVFNAVFFVSALVCVLLWSREDKSPTMLPVLRIP